jgi:hypothetical protein
MTAVASATHSFTIASVNCTRLDVWSSATVQSANNFALGTAIIAADVTCMGSWFVKVNAPGNDVATLTFTTNAAITNAGRFDAIITQINGSLTT